MERMSPSQAPSHYGSSEKVAYSQGWYDALASLAYGELIPASSEEEE